MTLRQFPKDPTDRALLQAVLEAPHDDTPRLVYADRLIERGDPRGELIVVQCAMEKVEREHGSVHEYAALRRREKELRRMWTHHWYAFGGESWAGELHRGFFTKVHASLETLRYRWRLFAAHPIEHLVLSIRQVAENESGPPLGAYHWLLRKPTFQRTTKVQVVTFRAHFWFDTKAFCEVLNGVDAADAEPTRGFGSPTPHHRLQPALRSVWLEHFEPANLRLLTYHQPKLEGIGYRGGHLEAFTELLRPSWPGLRSFDVLVYGGSISAEAVDRFASHPMLETVERLRLPGDEKLLAALGRARAPKLRSLSLHWVKEDLLRAFAESPIAAQLESLSVNDTSVASIACLAKLPLRHLEIRGVKIELETAKQLAASPTLYGLTAYYPFLVPGAEAVLEERWGALR
jgi:uncharacterized protein (TIGR02996 family)